MASMEDVELLSEFLAAFRADVRWIAWERPDLLESELVEFIRDAWNAEEWRIEQAQKELSVGDDAVLARLDALGLAGPSLRFKMAGVSRARRRIDRSAIVERLRSGVKKLLGWSDVLLGSIAQAFPALEPIKEIKEGIEQSIPD